MSDQPTYEDLERRLRERERAASEDRRSIAMLEDREGRCRSLLEGIPVGLYRTEEDGRITDANSALAELLGFPDRESLLSQRSSRFFVRSEDQEEERRILHREGVLHGFEAELRRSDGSVIWVRDSARAIRRSDGRMIYEGSLEDITERKRAEEQIHLRMKDINRVSRLAVGREQRILELKREVNLLSEQLGRAHPYTAVTGIDASAPGDTGDPADPWSEEVPSLKTLIPLDEFEKLIHGFCESVGVASAIIDLQGVTLVESHWQRLCTGFHRVNETTCRRCIESDTELALRLKDGETFAIYQCLNGLTDAASPIVIGGRHVANLFVGQFLLHPPDETFFRRQAAEYGFDEAAYMEALREVPIVSRDGLPAILDCLTGFAVLLGTLGLERFRQKQNEARLAGHNEALVREREAALSLAEDAEAARLAAERSRAALRDSERRYRALFERTLNPIAIVDPEGSFIDANPAFLSFVEKPKERLLGMRISDFAPPDNGENKKPDHMEILKMRGTIETVFFIDGKEKILDLTITPIRYISQKAILCSGKDITESKKLQSQLQQSHKMEAIGTLAGGIAHDFNNILGIIVGHAELAMLDLPEWVSAKDNLRKVRDATLRARDLVRQILLFARQKEHSLSTIRLEPIARESLKLLRASIPATVEMCDDIEEGLPPILGDPSQIQQVIMNLCTNAGQVMEAEGGTLMFTLNRADLDAPLNTVADTIPSGRYVCMHVRDTGPGIPAENLNRIFDPFFTTKGVGEGTGLGLAVVHGIVQERRGGITVESEEGRGTTFSVYLPASDMESVEEEKGQEAEPPRGTERILFVDDEPMIMNLGEQMLRRQGYHVETRASGMEALECFREDPGRFDLVVTDMSMPGMRGDRLAEEIMAIRPDIPVILCTGYSRQVSEDKAGDMGIRALVMKPLTQRELANAVREVLDRR